MAGEKRPGSPDGEPEYLAVGFLRRPHGVQGEILMDVHTDFPERLKAGRQLFLGPQHLPVTLAGIRPNGDRMLVRLEGIDTPEAAGRYRNTWLFSRLKDLPPLPEGRYYKHQVLGLDVRDEADRPLGYVTEILETGANDVYVVKDPAGHETLLPAIPEVILEIDMDAGILRVHLLEGL
jgi:16S rRNA processing protein RimM